MKLVSQIVLIAVTLAAVAGGVVLLLRGPSSAGMEIVLPTATPPSEAELKVYISGAVRNPGVYTLNKGDRLDQAIEVAGGTTVDADLSAVNLALRVRDEDHWQIPRRGEAPSTSAVRRTGTAGRIDINSATAAELESLPGIGEVKAESIISYREANGPFSSVEELLGVHGIGPATVEAIRELVEAR